MCLEVYHPELPIIIRYANETLRFEEPQTTYALYAFLVQNAGNVPLEYLNVLFPHQLYVKAGNDWQFGGVEDLIGEIPEHLEGCYNVPGTPGHLRLVRPDPNRPQFDMPPLEGEWIKRKARMLVPRDFSPNEVAFLSHFGYSFFQVQLEQDPIDPWAARWFCWKVHVARTGILRESPIGRIAVHQLASPCAVRHTLEEHLETVQRSAEKPVNEFVDAERRWLVELCRQMREKMGLCWERRVDIQLYELVVQPGEHFSISWDVERDLRMRSGSPREAKPGSPYEPQGELLYEWKTGSLLEPDRNPWRNEGFTLHLTLACGAS